MRIAYADPAFYWARPHSKNPDEIDLPCWTNGHVHHVRGYLQGRADVRTCSRSGAVINRSGVDRGVCPPCFRAGKVGDCPQR